MEEHHEEPQTESWEADWDSAVIEIWRKYRGDKDAYGFREGFNPKDFISSLLSKTRQEADKRADDTIFTKIAAERVDAYTLGHKAGVSEERQRVVRSLKILPENMSVFQKMVNAARADVLRDHPDYALDERQTMSIIKRFLPRLSSRVLEDNQ